MRAVGRRYPAQVGCRGGYWTIQNEPNQPGWLDPQWVRSRGHWVEASPSLYRGLVDAAWRALQDTGHGRDTILIGETAPKGVSVRGTTRALSAAALHQAPVLPRRPSAAAARRGRHRARLPGFDDARRVSRRAPGLFASTGYAHHPYELIFAPNRRPAHTRLVHDRQPAA